MGRNGSRWSQRIVPLGIPTQIIADDPDVLSTALAAYSAWTGDSSSSKPAIELRLEASNASFTGVNPAIVVDGSRLCLRGPDYEGEADALTGTASCRIPRRYVGRPHELADEVLDPLLLFLLARRGRTPVHGAGVVVGDRLLALMGPSGSGKSSIALAAARRGLRVLTDDTLHVESGPPLRIWGMGGPIHVLPEDARGAGKDRRTRGGKTKAVIPLAEAGAQRGPFLNVTPVLLERGEHLALSELNASDAKARLGRPEPGFDLLAADWDRAIDALLANGAWTLTLERDPERAVEFLIERFGA